MRLLQLAQKRQKVVLGLMSGTSADAVDAALCRIAGAGEGMSLELLHFRCAPWPPQVRREILACSSARTGRVDRICRLNFLLGELFAEAALAAMAEAGLAPSDVDLIGSHGQTVHHLPVPEELCGRQVTGTLQIAEPAVIAKRTGIVTVADFRPADMAVGGQGAPLVPFVDYLLFRSPTENRCVLNIGGIANVTLLPASCAPEQVLAFDTGPGNMLIDGLMRRFFRRTLDRDGAVAARGRCDERLVGEVLRHPFFARLPPKSTGREEFGGEFLRWFVRRGERLRLARADLVATATALTAASIHDAVVRFAGSALPLHRLIVSGGGASNPTLLHMLACRFGSCTLVERSDAHGIPAQAKEAISFAVLANATVADQPGNLPGATGASRRTVLGKICLP
ncbi:MAG: anhydro-N-acetylmuramic acid kinase [bacterium]|jgi:anhydro-N-acetylmuramic acid kinase|nr:anhydro-N-acetylmuramic acid kinase [candidate division KSB1 bacterium]MDH7561156.1 anhydro-N-acetylmuramic acid kinase [bacterium]